MPEPAPLFNRAETYWGEARRPLAALLFLLPLLAVYEFGVLALGGGDAALRNGADFWMRGWLFSAGLQHPWLLPVVVIGLLGGWHLWERHPWRCSPETLVGMLAESLLFALALVVLGQLLHTGFERASLTTLSLPVAATGPAAAIIHVLPNFTAIDPTGPNQVPDMLCSARRLIARSIRLTTRTWPRVPMTPAR